MELSEFGRLLEQSPILFGKLLEKRGHEVSFELCQKIIKVFRKLTSKDRFQFRKNKSLPKKRVLRLAQQGELESSQAYLPFLLYEDYCGGPRTVVPVPSEEEIRFWLARRRPIDSCFLVDGQFCFWDATSNEFYVSSVSDGDPGFYQACATYLKERGSSFSTFDAARAEVVRRGLVGKLEVDTDSRGRHDGHPPG